MIVIISSAETIVFENIFYMRITRTHNPTAHHLCFYSTFLHNGGSPMCTKKEFSSESVASEAYYRVIQGYKDNVRVVDLAGAS